MKEQYEITGYESKAKRFLIITDSLNIALETHRLWPGSLWANVKGKRKLMSRNSGNGLQKGRDEG